MQAPRRHPVNHPKLCSGGLKRSLKHREPTRPMTDVEFRRAVAEGHRRFFAARRRDVDSFSFNGGLV